MNPAYTEFLIQLPHIIEILGTTTVAASSILILLKKNGYLPSKKMKKKQDLLNHKLFSENEFALHEISKIKIGSKLKTDLFQDVLRIKRAAIIKHSLKMINSPSIYKTDTINFYHEALVNLTDIIDDYNSVIAKKYGTDIYDMIMTDCDHGFNTAHEDTIQFMKKVMHDSFTSNQRYSSNVNKIDFMLDLYDIAMTVAVSKMEVLFNEFNGELDLLLKKRNKLLKS